MVRRMQENLPEVEVRRAIVQALGAAQEKESIGSGTVIQGAADRVSKVIAALRVHGNVEAELGPNDPVSRMMRSVLCNSGVMPIHLREMAANLPLSEQLGLIDSAAFRGPTGVIYLRALREEVNRLREHVAQGKGKLMIPGFENRFEGTPPVGFRGHVNLRPEEEH